MQVMGGMIAVLPIILLHVNRKNYLDIIIL